MAPLRSVLVSSFLMLSTAFAAKTLSYNSDFENTGGTAGTPVGSLQSGQPPPQPYDGLLYKNVVLARNDPTAVSQLNTPSGNVWIVNPVANMNPYITTGPNVISFSISTTLAGCAAATANGVVANPVNCTILFTGTKANTFATVSMTYNYVATTNPTGISTTIQLLKQVSFSSVFSDLIRLDVRPVSSPVTPTLTSIGLDRVVHTVKTN